MKTIIRAKGGSKERTVQVNKIVIPDLWKVIHNHEVELSAAQKAQVLETWHLCHDLLRAVKESP